MKIKIPRLLQNATLYSITTLLQKGIGFFLLPLYTAFLTPSDYGVMNLLSSVSGFLSILILFSLNGAAARFHFKPEYVNKRPLLWGAILLLVLINSLFWTGAAIVFHKYLIDPITGGIPFWSLTVFSIVNVAFSPLYLFYQHWLQTTENGKRYAINMMVNFLLTTALNILFVAVLRMGVKGMLFSSLLVAIVFFIYSFVEFIPKIDFKFSKEISKDAYKYSLPLLPHSMSAYLSILIDRVLLNKYSTASTLGLFSVASQFGSIIDSVTTSINRAFSPWFMHECQDNSPNNDSINKIASASIIICSYLALFIVMFSPEVIRIMTSSAFDDSWEPVAFICFGYVFNGLYYFLSLPLFLASTQYVFLITASRLFVNVVLNIILIPHMGYWGAGIAFIASTFSEAMVAMLISRRKCPFVRYDNFKLFGIILFFLIVASSVYYIEIMNNPVCKVFLKIFILSFLGLVIYKRYGTTITSFIKFSKS